MDLDKIRRILIDTDAPEIFQALFSNTSYEATVLVDDGCAASVVVEITNGKKTAFAEYTNAGTLCRFELSNTDLVFSCFDIKEGDLLNQTRLPLEELQQTDPSDSIAEFMERVQ